MLTPLQKMTGLFSLKPKSNKEHKVQVSALGLQTVNEKFLTKDEDIQKDYTLRSDILLDEVVVKMPITIKGDTLIYDADFKNGSERKLEDIMENFPSENKR